LRDGEEAELDGDEHPNRVERGRMGEQAAETFLAGRGYQVVARNQRTPVGELDLVCRDRAEVVIVEVKARYNEEFGAALEAIGPRKARRLRAAALWWLSERGMFPCSVRFDAVVVSIDRRGLPLGLEHLRDVIGEGG
jgi:putative endonuclease